MSMVPMAPMGQKRKVVQVAAVPVGQGHVQKRGRGSSSSSSSVAIIHAREVGLKQPPGVLDPDWEKNYVLLRGYIAEKHNARVPATLDTSRYPKLGQWCVAQREAYRHEMLRAELGDEGIPELPARVARRISQQEIASLEAVGFEWGQTAWDNKFELLKQWAAEHGTTRVPRGQIVNGVKLGKWVGTQRQAYRSEQMRERGENPPKNSPRINPVQVAKLNSVGFEWGGLKPLDWEAKFHLLQKYVGEHGHCRVPVRLNTEDYPKLGVWIMQQRAAFKSGRLTVSKDDHNPKYRIPAHVIQDRVRRLNELGFEWHIPAPNAEEAKLRAEKRARARAEKRSKLKAEKRLEKMLLNDSKQRERALQKQRLKAEKAAARARKRAEREAEKAGQKAREKEDKAAAREAKKAEAAAARAELRRQRVAEREALLETARRAAAERGDAPMTAIATPVAAAVAGGAGGSGGAAATRVAVPVDGTFLAKQPKLSPEQLEEFKREVAEKARATAEATKAARAERTQRAKAKQASARKGKDGGADAADADAGDGDGAAAGGEGVEAGGEDDGDGKGAPGRPRGKGAAGAAGAKKRGKKKKDIVYKNSTWELNLALLRSYVREHGHARVPTTLDTPDFPKLGQWVSYSRRAYRNELLRESGHAPGSTARITPARIAKLNELGFVWDPFDTSAQQQQAAQRAAAAAAAAAASDAAVAAAASDAAAAAAAALAVGPAVAATPVVAKAVDDGAK